MFYDLGLRIAFIHVPRTGGVAVTVAFRPVLGLGGGCDLGVRRHLSANDMRAVIGPDADGLRWFAIYRPFGEIRASFERLLLRDRERERRGARFSASWSRILHASDPMAAAWDEAGWPETEKEWWEFWIGAERDIILLDFQRLKDDLAALCRSLRLPLVELPRRRVN